MRTAVAGGARWRGGGVGAARRRRLLVIVDVSQLRAGSINIFLKKNAETHGDEMRAKGREAADPEVGLKAARCEDQIDRQRARQTTTSATWR